MLWIGQQRPSRKERTRRATLTRGWSGALNGPHRIAAVAIGDLMLVCWRRRLDSRATAHAGTVVRGVDARETAPTAVESSFLWLPLRVPLAISMHQKDVTSVTI